MPKKRDFALDILRVLSCVMVFGVHLGQHVSIPGVLGAFFEKGSTGVSFFFILSGFLAYYSLDRIFVGKKLEFNLVLKYWIKRAIHILPLYYLVIFFYFVFYSATNQVPSDPTGLYWFRYVFFINLWVPTDVVFWTNLGAVWSISAFVLFYLLAPFYYLLVKKYYVSWIGLLLSYIILKITDMGDLGSIPIRYMFYFFLGITIRLSIDEHKEFGITCLLAISIVFFILTGSGTALAAPLMASLYIIGTRNVETILSESNIIYRGIAYISAISYSIYLDHALIVNLLDFIGIEDSIVYALVLIVGTLVLSVITYNIIEVRLARFLESKIYGKR